MGCEVEGVARLGCLDSVNNCDAGLQGLRELENKRNLPPLLQPPSSSPPQP